MKSDDVYLLHILDTIERVQRYTSTGEAAFREDTMMQDAVLRNLQTMAESSQRLSEAVRAANPDVRWRAIAGFRNVVVHDYLGIDLAEVWAIIHQHLRSSEPGSRPFLGPPDWKKVTDHQRRGGFRRLKRRRVAIQP